MRSRDVLELVVLAAIWGASYLFMRVAAPEFGPVPLMQIRVACAAACLIPVLIARSRWPALKAHWRAILVVGAFNSALPFCLLAYSTLYLTGGFTAIVNATSPLFGAAVAWLWLGDRLTRSQVLGLGVGFAGVVILVWNKVSLDLAGAGLAVPAAILASALYGVSANYTKRYLTGVPPLAVATGSQIAATLLLLPIAVPSWPEQAVSRTAWSAVIVMGIVCTALAYLLYFRLIANAGPAKAISVTYLIPGFAVLWGALFLHEGLTVNMIAGCVVILAGTAMANGLVRLFE